MASRVRRDHLLEVVEDEEHLPFADVVGEAVLGADRLRDLVFDDARVADRREFHPEGPSLVVADEFCRRFDREAGLPRASRAGEGHETGPIADQGGHGCHLVLSADERAGRTRQVRVRDRLQWREVLVAELEDQDGSLEVL